MKPRGRLITLEGPEGSGKSTQVRALRHTIADAWGCDVLTLREPGGTPTGEAIRGILQHDAAGEPLCPAAEVFLFCASRAQLCATCIAPALARGDWVVCDRFTDSTLAYQGYGRGFDLDLLRRLNRFATDGLQPDLTLLLDVPIEVGMARIGQRSVGRRDRIEREALAFHQRLRDGYLALAAAEPGRFVVLDATPPVATVTGRIREIVRSRLAPPDATPERR